MHWARLLAFITGAVNQELLLRNEYLVAENKILRAQIKGRLNLSAAERKTLAEIGHRLGAEILADIANVARPETILAWYRKLVAKKFDGSKNMKNSGRPKIDSEVEQLIVRMATDNPTWGYDRIVGSLSNLGYEVSDQTVGNVLKRNGLPTSPERKKTTTWAEFIRSHLAVLAGTDFFSVEVLTCRGLVTYYVLFFIHLESRRIEIAGITPHPKEPWMMQMARNLTMEGWGFLNNCSYLIHDRDTKYTASFREILRTGNVTALPIPPRSPNLNAYCERWVRSVKEECLSKLILFGEGSLRRALNQYVEHFHEERNHQGKGNVLLFPGKAAYSRDGSIRCKERLGGMLRFYYRDELKAA